MRREHRLLIVLGFLVVVFVAVGAYVLASLFGPDSTMARNERSSVSVVRSAGLRPGIVPGPVVRGPGQ